MGMVLAMNKIAVGKTRKRDSNFPLTTIIYHFG
jgi:hypothetical protein